MKTQAAPASLLASVEALLEQALQLLEIQRAAQQAPQPDNGPQSNELMDVKQTMAYTGLTDWSIRNAVRQKKIPHVRVASRIFFRKRELDAWIAREMNGGG
ncbi:helix-turn-helix domain-containing protein [Paenibacillus sp. BK720]|uniref:helix-turn-helix domain-containing protein n=1 Tax=Paenibacillus sp. BK720 TaxID=2587092 RepID=UPI0014240793|nr:helix-turn-helix domain-containing protein [Paenibacillus sp. BK720]NIK68775.1 putative DNA-binding transcriptional regulator AlpA [Paenibacillus sp. BK720]